MPQTPLAMIHHTNKIKDKYPMINSVDVKKKKACDMIQHPFMIKTLNKMGIKRKYLNENMLSITSHQTDAN